MFRISETSANVRNRFSATEHHAPNTTELRQTILTNLTKTGLPDPTEERGNPAPHAALNRKLGKITLSSHLNGLQLAAADEGVGGR